MSRGGLTAGPARTCTFGPCLLLVSGHLSFVTAHRLIHGVAVQPSHRYDSPPLELRLENAFTCSASLKGGTCRAKARRYI